MVGMVGLAALWPRQPVLVKTYRGGTAPFAWSIGIVELVGICASFGGIMAEGRMTLHVSRVCCGVAAWDAERCKSPLSKDGEFEWINPLTLTLIATGEAGFATKLHGMTIGTTKRFQRNSR